MALNLLQKAKQKRDSIKQLRKAAGWDNNQLLIFYNIFLYEAALQTNILILIYFHLYIESALEVVYMHFINTYLILLHILINQPFFQLPRKNVGYAAKTGPCFCVIDSKHD